ncbi:DUF6064 family protein [Marinobacter sp. M1N3S26]|uniref:DUF6064 family protein n=1 Tax=unclassified Marinobacter TaxID=83889 RepID=UPI00387AEC70
MDTLLSYHPQDFLLFSPRVYWALVAGNNVSWWWLALLAPVAGLLLAWQLGHRGDKRHGLVFGGMGLVWWFVTWSFLWQQYRVINWAVDWAIVPFVAMGGLFLLFVLKAGEPLSRLHRHWAGLLLVVWGTLIHPLGFLLDQRGVQAADTWLLFPDPLAITTLGVVLVTLDGWRLALAIPVPLLWSLIGGITLLGLGSPIGWAMLAAAVIALLGALPLTRAGQSQRGTC